jgi:hypothetical protein
MLEKPEGIFVLTLYPSDRHGVVVLGRSRTALPVVGRQGEERAILEIPQGLLDPPEIVSVRCPQVSDAVPDLPKLSLPTLPRSLLEQRIAELRPMASDYLDQLGVVEIGQRVVAVDAGHVPELGINPLPEFSRLDRIGPGSTQQGPKLEVDQFAQPRLQLPPSCVQGERPGRHLNRFQSLGELRVHRRRLAVFIWLHGCYPTLTSLAAVASGRCPAAGGSSLACEAGP